MAASQAVQTKPSPADVDSLPEAPSGERMTLAEMARIMDVAATLRKEKTIVDQQLNLDQIKAKLRERMLEAARVSGDPVTAEEIGAAIEQYYDRLHKFQEPRFGFHSLLAHLWIRRRAILGVAFGFAALFLLIWGLLASGVLPGEARNRQLSESIERSAGAIQKISDDESVRREVAAILGSAKSAGERGEAGALAELSAKLRELQAQLDAEYTVAIAGRNEGEQSAFERNWTDENGTRLSGYYVIVEARRPDGSAVNVPIENYETGKTEQVSRWAEQVPEEVFNRLEADKKADGVLDQRVFGVKHRGERSVEMQLPGADGRPLARQRQITSWP